MGCESSNSGPDRPAGGAAGKILEIAEALFAEKGYEATSIRDIAQRAGVSKANVFHHFGSKEGLYMEVLRQACRHTARALQEVAGTSDEDPRAALEQFLARQARMLFEHPRSSRLIQRELLEHASVRGQRLAEEVFSEHFTRLVGLVRQGQAKGQLRAEIDPALLAFLLIGANVFFFETHSVLRHLPEVTFTDSPEAYSAAVFALLAAGFDREDRKGGA